MSTLAAALQLGDSFFPSGLYTLSHGLESFIQSGSVKDEESLAALIRDYLYGQVGPADAVACAAACRAVSDGDVEATVAVDELLHATKLPAESAVGATRSGRQVLRTALAISDNLALREYSERVGGWGQAPSLQDRERAAGAGAVGGVESAGAGSRSAPGCYAVVAGALAGAVGLTPADAATIELHGFTTSLLGVAVRSIRLGHIAAQRILASLRDDISTLAERAADTPYHEIWSFAPCIEVMQMRHSRAEVRLFAS